MKITCSSIEYVPHSLELKCHRAKTINFNVVKIKNLKMMDGVVDETIVIPGKSFIYQLGYPIYHSIIDKSGQFELLRELYPEIKPYFMFNRGFWDSDANSIEGYTDEQSKNIRTMYQKDKELKEYYVSGKSFEVDLENIYRQDLNISQDGYYQIGIHKFVFEELYLIVDELKVIPEYLYSDFNLEKPFWFDKKHFTGNMGALAPFPQTKTQIDDEDFMINYPDMIRYGLSKFRERCLKYVPTNKRTYDKIFISRSLASARILETAKLLSRPIDKLDFNGIERIKDKRTKQAVVSKMISENKERYRYRVFKQEKELEDFFVAQGFKIVYLEKMDYYDELACFANAKEVVSLTGSSLVSSLMCSKETKIFEIMAPHPSLPSGNKNDSQVFFFYFSPVPGCMDEKGLTTSCIEKRNWYTIGYPDGTDQLEKIKLDYLALKNNC